MATIPGDKVGASVEGSLPVFEPKSTAPRPSWLSDGHLLPWSWAVERLSAERNYWLVTARRDGFPQARPVWGVWSEAGLLVSVGGGGLGRAAIADGAAAMPITVHLDDADDVVILEGVIDRVSGSHAPITFAIDRQQHRSAVEAYNAKYSWDFDPDDPESRLNFLVRPHVAYGWHATSTSVEGGTRWRFSD
jgi:hypothetical protein